MKRKPEKVRGRGKKEERKKDERLVEENYIIQIRGAYLSRRFNASRRSDLEYRTLEEEHHFLYSDRSREKLSKLRRELRRGCVALPPVFLVTPYRHTRSARTHRCATLPISFFFLLASLSVSVSVPPSFILISLTHARTADRAQLLCISYVRTLATCDRQLNTR